MANTANLRPGGPGRPKGSKNKLTKERSLLQQAEERFNSREYWERSAWPRIARGKAPHLEGYFLQRIYGKPVESVALSGEAKKPIRVTIEVVRDKPLPAGPDTPALPGQVKRLPFRAGDGNLGAQTPIDVGLNNGRYRSR
jgi:hypothetical protein